jgi:hypothetical protein
MPDRTGTLERIAMELGNALRQVGKVLAPEETLRTLSEFGVDFPSQLLDDPGFAAARSSAVTAADDLGGAIEDLVGAIEADDVAGLILHGLRTIEAAARVTMSFDDLVGQLQVTGPTMPGVTAAQITELTNNFPTRLFDFLVTEQLDSVPAVGATLTMLGLIERTWHPPETGNPTSRGYETSQLRFDRLGPLVGGPERYFEGLYDWGSPTFDGDKLLRAVDQLVARMGLPSRFQPAAGGQPARAEAFALGLEVAPGNPPGLDVDLLLPIVGGIDHTVVLPHPAWTAHVRATASAGAGASGTIRPPLDISLRPVLGAIAGDVDLEIRGRPAQPFVLLGVAGGTRLELAQVDASLGIDVAWNPATGEAALAPRIGGGVSGGKLVIAAGEADGFISKLLSGVGLQAEFEAAIGWTSAHGVQFTGSSTLEIALPVHIAIGPLEIPTLYLVLGLPAGGGAFPLELSVDLKAALGPLVAVASRIGTTAELSFPTGGGNLGPAQLEFAFKPPNGVGLAVNAGPVKGGGFLYIDAARGEYAGALELDFTGIVALKAIGLITTRMPDGSSGFSLLIVITAEFGTGIQLGFGFTLLGVGGVLGLNRSMALTPLVEGVRSGAINSVMFPKDVIANAPRIISDLRTFFPPQEGRFVIGPMAKLGWGTPTLVSLSLGIIIEIPGNIAILGVLKLALPAADAPLIVLQVNFLGAIEFDKKRLYFFASIFDSRVIFLTIEGEMAVLAAFGDDANFVLSIGGFHPSFSPPPLPVPTPRRIAVNILNEPGALLRVEGYFAVTTNTAQFGARLDLRLGFSSFGIEGHLAFDALLQFSPLHFEIAVSGSLSLKAFGVGMFSIRLRLSLEGPAPWRARGTGSISFLFWEIEADFDITFGEAPPSALPPIEVMPVIEAEFEKPESWRALLPAGNNLLVSLRALDPTVDALVLHPVGVLRVSQRAIPLDLGITRVGSRKPTDVKRLGLNVATGGLAERADVQEKFAPAQFQDFADAAKLSKPAFQPMHGGIDLSVSGDQLASGAMVKRVIRYELITIDTQFRRYQRFRLLAVGLFQNLLSGAAVARSELSMHVLSELQPFPEKITVQAEPFVVASTVDNQPVAAAFASEAMAAEHLQQQLSANPALTGSLHVIPRFEAIA